MISVKHHAPFAHAFLHDVRDSGEVEAAYCKRWWQSAPSTNPLEFTSHKTLDVPHSALQKAAGGLV
jgi:hypothetical protein